MNERERDRLLSKLELLLHGLETELEEFRRKRSALGDRYEGCWVCEETEFFANYLDRFSTAAIETAKAATRDPEALEIVRDQYRSLHDRFDWQVALNRQSPLLHRYCPAKPFEKEGVQRRFQNAVVTADMRLNDAQFDFDELPIATRQQPDVAVVDEWISRCPATNHKAAWREIRNQREFPAPLYKVFYERWKELRPAKRGRPKTADVHLRT